LIGYGIISKRNNVKAFRIRINTKAGVIRVLTLINGKLLTNQKIEKFNAACALYGVMPINSSENNCSPSTAWFSGFFDGDGHISIRNEYT
jgi:hypothetical protein